MSTAAISISPPAEPAAGKIWLLLGDKPGDNAQARAVAEALGRPYTVKTLLPKPEWVLGKPRFRPTLDHLDMTRSDPLQPPWPDSAITIGRRPAAAALWVKERSPATRLVVVGRPKRWPDRFDLIVAPTQFRVDRGANVVPLDLPLVGADAAAMAAAADAWRNRLAALPKPLTAVLVGGETKPFRFGAAEAAGFLAKLETIRDGGTLYATTSRRTKPEVVEALAAGLPGATLHRWAPAATENPYMALLGLADRFVVTGDSISMMVEVARLGRPLAIFELPYAQGIGTTLRRAVVKALDPREGIGPLAWLGGSLARAGLLSYGRDLGALHRWLYARGLAVPLGEPFPAPSPGIGLELAEVTRRIADMLPR